MGKKKYIIIGVAAILLLYVLSIGATYKNSQQGTVNLKVVPSDSTIVTDKGNHLKQGANKLGNGNYQLTITRAHFSNKTVNISVVKNKAVSYTVALEPSDDIGREYMIAHPAEQAVGDGTVSKEADSAAISAATKYPLISELPVDRGSWRIDYGRSQLHPTDTTEVALYITSVDAANKQAALDWIRQQGFDPSKYEIVFQDVATYQQQLNPTGGDSSVDNSTPPADLDSTVD